MKMFLTRIGFGSRAVVTGDVTQVDLPREKISGLRHAMYLLENMEGVGITQFNVNDVVRHPLVKRIVDAYEKAEGN
jgi:phosphate starvation-inducible PhoH-like protein